ncbi:MAG: TolC family protein [Pirellulaceae bacterium]|nr:TolC family protein [Pirellulaceae bacterium]
MDCFKRRLHFSIGLGFLGLTLALTGLLTGCQTTRSYLSFQRPSQPSNHGSVDDSSIKSTSPIKRLPTLPMTDLTAVALISHQETLPEGTPSRPNTIRSTSLNFPWENSDSPEEITALPRSISPIEDTHYPIDLANALGLGGASDLQIRLARERVIEAQAEFLAAKTAWLPSLRFAVGWNKHDGRLQETEGNILEVSRNSLFVGGGAGLGTAPLTGAASGPPRMIVNLSLSDAIFEPQVFNNLLAAQRANRSRVFNDSLSTIGLAYFNLLEAYGRLANAQVVLSANRTLLRLTTDFAQAGAGSEADASRAKAAFAMQERVVDEAKRQIAVASAELVRLIRLDASLKLAPAEEKVAVIELVDPTTPIEELIALGMSTRPELAQSNALIAATAGRVAQERWRPWLPNVMVGASGGSFGGGQATEFENQAGRSDIDLQAVWELENVGYGNRADRNRSRSQFRQAQIRFQLARDNVAAQIVTAASNVAGYREQVRIAMQGAQEAERSNRLNFERVKEAEGLPLELLQSITALQTSLDDYTNAVANHNRSQIELVRAIGQTPGAPPKPLNPSENRFSNTPADLSEAPLPPE